MVLQKVTKSGVLSLLAELSDSGGPGPGSGRKSNGKVTEKWCFPGPGRPPRARSGLISGF